jgi:hypothetical protein
MDSEYLISNANKSGPKNLYHWGSQANDINKHIGGGSNYNNGVKALQIYTDRMFQETIQKQRK